MLGSRLLVFGATLLAVAAATVWSTHRHGAGLVSTPPPTCQQPCAPFDIVWVGDILLGDHAQLSLDQHGYTWPFEQVRPLLADAFVIGNAEGPLTTRREPYFPKQKWSYNALPDGAPALAEVGFDALGLSNNHALDRGPDGLQDTIRNLQAAGLRTFGAGMTFDEAAAPLMIETGYGTVAVLGIGRSWNYGAVAGPARAGTVTYTDDMIARLKASAVAAGARWVVAYVHWGENYEKVTSEQRRVGEALARAGYDLVIGGHPHVPQEVEIVGGTPVLYSLGNFTFGSTGGFSRSMPGVGLVVRTAFGPDGLQSMELRCVVTDNKIVSYQPQPCSTGQAQSLLRRLGDPVAVRGDVGVVTLPTRQR
jgi:poly-gamma-glutamate synthesis protein (capsule biosynthesis protein)